MKRAKAIEKFVSEPGAVATGSSARKIRMAPVAIAPGSDMASEGVDSLGAKQRTHAFDLVGRRR
ncbi:MAG TPA: hypothetical protein VE961_26965, partial [Pyrinomonadaceae bacterium]|nr:hypothetical protein [Pyrinomonadaceae bacterium]